jgi:shikimate kinase
VTVESLCLLLRNYEEGLYTAAEVSGMVVTSVLEEVMEAVLKNKTYGCVGSWCSGHVPARIAVCVKLQKEGSSLWVQACR